MYKIRIAVFFLILVGCATTLNLTPEEEAYLNKVKKFPLEFKVSKADENNAWGRAQSFIGRYSSMKLQTATDFVIQTYNPSSPAVKFGYYVTKTPGNDSTTINVECICGNMFSGSDADNNAHILAYYIYSGELPHPNIIRK